ncbi:GNAT family N-acetyltransferase [Desulfuribacillus stibiiarsenatis]|uniref:GNAT family N-acetyltransferase n=1 Tax=Desulfuribacillus stibiiarsenatis TaxID=1390249 RepID=A0A1E5L2T1_9FIRM|nr:GNAT family N-acetyltransferase [Desulfuribacillus stibiiarsenatis]
MTIRIATEDDFLEVWGLLQPVFQKGDSYPHPPEMTEEEAFHLWMEVPIATYVAIQDHKPIGTYYIKANQIGLGNHVCNSGYVVSPEARGLGLGRMLCEHSKAQAKALGFLAMQFNFVVSTNTIAVNLWQSCGFSIVGTLPKAFRHLEKGLVDAYVMYHWLE